MGASILVAAAVASPSPIQPNRFLMQVPQVASLRPSAAAMSTSQQRRPDCWYGFGILRQPSLGAPHGAQQADSHRAPCSATALTPSIQLQSLRPPAVRKCSASLAMPGCQPVLQHHYTLHSDQCAHGGMVARMHHQCMYLYVQYCSSNTLVS